jgi:arginyl-tRNA synthetase
MIKEEIKKIIEKVIKGFTNEPANFSVEIPAEKTHGDYSTNVALILAKQINKNPREVAELIKEKINNKLFVKIEVAGPGFINFFVADKIFTDNLKNVDRNYGKNGELKNQKIIIDYTDPNPFKEFHIGHLMQNAIGESLSRIFEQEGARLKRVCYQGDVGMHVAKAIWGKMNNEAMSWGQAYAFGATAFEEKEESKKEITELNKKIFERSDKQVNKLYDEGKKESLKHFDEIYKKLGTKFDYFIFESQVMDIGKKIVLDGLKEGIFETGENGAIVLKGEKFGLHTRVFINSEGLPTYEAKDLGLAKVKYQKYKYDQSVVVTANEQNDYFKVMLCAMKQVDQKLAEKTGHISHGMLRFAEGKMSSRTGKIITGESLIEKVQELVKEKIKGRNLSEKEISEIAEVVSIGAIKYSILKQSIGSDIIYDFDKSISFDGDSGPYLQYAYTRAMSVLKKAKAEKIKPSFKNIPGEITELEKVIYNFHDVVLKAGKEYEPHFIVLYLTELAGEFNSYYAKNKIVDKMDKFSPYKIALTKAFMTVMENGLNLLGIKTLEKM